MYIFLNIQNAQNENNFTMLVWILMNSGSKYHTHISMWVSVIVGSCNLCEPFNPDLRCALFFPSFLLKTNSTPQREAQRRSGLKGSQRLHEPTTTETHMLMWVWFFEALFIRIQTNIVKLFSFYAFCIFKNMYIPFYSTYLASIT